MSEKPLRDKSRGRSRSWRRGLLFRAAVVGATALVIEAASLLTLYLMQGGPRSVAELRDRDLRTDPVKLIFDRRLSVMIHPYLGSVLQPSREQNEPGNLHEYRVTDFGFPDTELPLRKRSDDRLIVAVLGGSVAMQMAKNSARTIEEELRTIPEFSGRSIEFVRLAINGYKQPQQLMAVTYLLTLGAEFDLVINLDGVNEASLPKIENVPFKVAASYPRRWIGMVTAADSPQLTRKLGYITWLRENQRRWAEQCAARPWRWSFTALLLWKGVADRREREVFRGLEELDRMRADSMSYCASGPPETYESDRDVYEHCADVWARSSIQLHHVCAAHGARYFHFLQPNQHPSPPTKVFSPEEEELGFEISPFRGPIVECYPLMQARVARMKQSGVAFQDLKQVFANHSGTIYVDNFCHVNKTGDEIMARAIGETIRRHFENSRK